MYIHTYIYIYVHTYIYIYMYIYVYTLAHYPVEARFCLKGMRGHAIFVASEKTRTCISDAISLVADPIHLWQVGTFSRGRRRSTTLEDVALHGRCGSRGGFWGSFFRLGFDIFEADHWLISSIYMFCPHFAGFITILVG